MTDNINDLGQEIAACHLQYCPETLWPFHYPSQQQGNPSNGIERQITCIMQIKQMFGNWGVTEANGILSIECISPERTTGIIWSDLLHVTGHIEFHSVMAASSPITCGWTKADISERPWILTSRPQVIKIAPHPLGSCSEVNYPPLKIKCAPCFQLEF